MSKKNTKIERAESISSSQSSLSQSGDPDRGSSEHAKRSLFNENWNKLKPEDKLFAEKRFAQLGLWERRKFKPRNSLIHDLFADSTSRHYSLRGFYHLFVLGLGFLLVSHPVISYRNTGRFFNPNFLETFQKDFFKVIATWPCFTLWTFWAFFLQKAHSKGMSAWMVITIQHLTQLIMLISSIYLVMVNDWGVTHSLFISFQACIHFMKMHSYNEVNYLLAKEARFCQAKGIPAGSNYPANVNLKDFWFYLVAPVLVYEMNLPKVPRRNWWFLLEKVFLAIITLFVQYVIVGEQIIPVFLLGKQITALEAVYRLCVPFLFIIVNMFFLIWENILSGVAELSGFADREFYLDWWNSTTFEEFNRKWNKVVHEFLFRHIYLDFHLRWKWSKWSSQLLTFFVSAIFHEFIVLLTIKTPAFHLMIFMMAQIPLFAVTQKMKDTVAGNFFFWWGLIQGFPLILVLYTKNLYQSELILF